jgi:hypothetical protein
VAQCRAFQIDLLTWSIGMRAFALALFRTPKVKRVVGGLKGGRVTAAERIVGPERHPARGEQ